jgi:transposase
VQSLNLGPIWQASDSLSPRAPGSARRPFLFPNIRTVIADAGHQSAELARHLLCQDGWKLQIVKRRQRAFKITGLTWIAERSFAWLGRNRRLKKGYEYCVQSSETLIEIAATRLMLNRLAQA